MRAYKQEGRVQRRKPESGNEERAPGSNPLPLSTRFSTSRTCLKSLSPAANKDHRKVQPVLEDPLCLPKPVNALINKGVLYAHQCNQFLREASRPHHQLYAHQCNQFARGIAPAFNSSSTRVIHANGVCSTPATGKRYAKS